ncbi:hypothetical protein EJ04DRAFT_227848 [Polyplosphaeria fusca]|uniref:Uncharacterized protein n=1 Tax=Polyplosphaeria fusca TaxID=682080 RepID=A0A9P4R148_9PLEO|nr:hypothetical protein EJ04DRAFT_227848 [Polyplosphaeria fusca]
MRLNWTLSTTAIANGTRSMPPIATETVLLCASQDNLGVATFVVTVLIGLLAPFVQVVLYVIKKRRRQDERLARTRSGMHDLTVSNASNKFRIHILALVADVHQQPSVTFEHRRRARGSSALEHRNSEGEYMVHSSLSRRAPAVYRGNDQWQRRNRSSVERSIV